MSVHSADGCEQYGSSQPSGVSAGTAAAGETRAEPALDSAGEADADEAALLPLLAAPPCSSSSSAASKSIFFTTDDASSAGEADAPPCAAPNGTPRVNVRPVP